MASTLSPPFPERQRSARGGGYHIAATWRTVRAPGPSRLNTWSRSWGRHVDHGLPLVAVSYGLGSVAGGVLAVFLGPRIGRLFF
jgi:hypothetical protein